MFDFKQILKREPKPPPVQPPKFAKAEAVHPIDLGKFHVSHRYCRNCFAITDHTRPKPVARDAAGMALAISIWSIALGVMYYLPFKAVDAVRGKWKCERCGRKS